ncbi:MAG: hypothetical protein A2Z35_02320 [Actinobacteria bacterium RBG_19FT_COMBO_36_27]|nr:MAG: hypothetical protein A2Z35_02320 [Actinobacteria bacterium RBG_19FT_COMBO_36_27]
MSKYIFLFFISYTLFIRYFIFNYYYNNNYNNNYIIAADWSTDISPDIIIITIIISLVIKKNSTIISKICADSAVFLYILKELRNII